MGNPSDMPLAVQLQMPDDTRTVLRQNEGAVAVAEAYEIDSHDMAVMVNDELKSTKASIKKLEELRENFIAPALQIVANAKALFDSPIKALTQAEGIYKGKLVAWQTAEQRRIAAEQAAAAEAARKLRQEAEQKAAAERARAQQQAEEARRREQEADQARRKAEAEGNARAAAAAAAEAAKQAQHAAALVENGEAKAQRAQLEAAAAPAPAPVQAAPAKLAGFSTKTNWSAAFAKDTTEADAIKLIAAILPSRPDLLGLLKLDMTAANRMAKALKGHFTVPGMMAIEETVAASRK